MKTPAWFPHPSSWASAVALFLFAGCVSMGMALAMPLLMELMRHSPRLAWLGMLGVWLAPIGAAGTLHRLGHGVLDLGDKKGATRSTAGGWGSLWAGFVAWAAIIFVTFTTSFVMLVLDPPPVDPDALWNLASQVMTRGLSGGMRSVIWIVIAAYVYQLERAGRSDHA